MMTIHETQPNYPSIFNDVIGPVMRGPSSSHCAAALRIGRIARDLMDANIEEVLIEFDTHGSLATTHDSQGSDMGLFGGLLGWEAADERLAESARAIQEAGIRVQIEIKDIGAKHPNTYKLTLKNSTEQHTLTAISTGGGMIEIVEIDGIEVSLAGDYYETLIYLDADGDEIVKYLRENIEADEILLLSGADTRMIEIKAQNFLEDGIISALHAQFDIKHLKTISPVLPVMSSQNTSVPFITCEEMLEYNADKNLALWELAVHYESARGNISHEQVFQQMSEIVRLMQKSILDGIAGTKYADRILGHQSGLFKTRMDKPSTARWRNVESDDPVRDRHDGGEKLHGRDRRRAHRRSMRGLARGVYRCGNFAGIIRGRDDASHAVCGNDRCVHRGSCHFCGRGRGMPG